MVASGGVKKGLMVRHMGELWDNVHVLLMEFRYMGGFTCQNSSNGALNISAFHCMKFSSKDEVYTHIKF